MKLLFLVSEDSYFCSHRLNLGIAAINAGFEVAIATRCQGHAEKIQKAGIKVFPLKHFNRSGLNPFSQWLSVRELYKIYLNYSPEIVHHVAIKPVIFGTFIAKWCKVPRIINAFGGLGYLFTASNRKTGTFFAAKKSILRRTVGHLLRWLHTKPNTTIILQNQDDMATFINATRINPEKINLIRGAGVNTQVFHTVPLPETSPIVITCISRMLWDKGIGELVEAVRIIQEKKISIPFKVILYGMPDPQNPASIEEKQLQAWNDSGVVFWKGYCHNAAEAYAQCHIAVLPSYREGLPKSLLEAASIGRPIVTTDVPGCREVVQHGKNGLLVPAEDATALANALMLLILDSDLQAKMAVESRRLVETYFSDTLVNQQTISLYQEANGINH